MVNYSEEQFIQNRTAGLIEWLSSKGTSYKCYIEFNNSLTSAQDLDIDLTTLRTIIGIAYKPLQYVFFYWTILLFILYKFNFKQRIMKLTLIFYSFRTLGELFKQIGGLWPYYFVNSSNRCIYNSMHPRKWLFENELGNTFSILGEIIGDLYPLLRTSDITKSKKGIRVAFFSCAIFNISKIVLIIYNLTLGPEKLYNIDGSYRENEILKRNNYYTLIQLIVTYASILYSITIWIVIRKYIYQSKYSEFDSFTRKFKNVPEFRLSCMEIFNVIVMLLVSSAGISHLIYNKIHSQAKVDFTMEELRDFLAGIQYFMIFVDQIFLIHSHNIPISNSNELYSSSYNNKHSTNSGVTSGRFHYENLNFSTNSDPLKPISRHSSISNNDFGFLNDNKYKGLTSYNNNNVNVTNEWK